MRVLIILTSPDQLGNTGRKTGFWLAELAAPYYVFKDAGAEIKLASPRGGQPPLDPKSNEPSFQTDQTRRFEADRDADKQLAQTVRLNSVRQEDFDTVFIPAVPARCRISPRIKTRSGWPHTRVLICTISATARTY
jgi:hypothetical protein